MDDATAGRGDRGGDRDRVVVDVLRASHSGQFPLNPGGDPNKEITMVYGDVTSVAVRFRRADDEDGGEGGDAASADATSADEEEYKYANNGAVMISAHVDSVHVSPGGSDNAINVGIALEVARALGTAAAAAGDDDEDKTRNVRNRNVRNRNVRNPWASRANAGSVIVVFVSAEEEGFHGAHGVATTHPWFPSVTCALNLEAMGNGGPHRMFQVTAGGDSIQLLKLWSKAAPRPSGTAVASDVFAAGVIKSDTDHRIYRDVGNVPGFDFAFVERTERYHTPRDVLSAVRPGTAQTSGANLLAFARAFVAAPAGVFEPGGVSRDPDVEPTGGNASKKSVFTTWWFSNAFPFSRDYVVVENVPRSAGKYFFYAGAAILLFTTRTAFLAGLHPVTGEIPAPTELLKNALAAPLVGVVTAAAFAAAPLAGAVSAAAASALLGAATPWASSVASLVCVSTVPATLATLGVLRVLHYLLADGCVGGSDAAASCATLAGVASTFFFLAGYAVLKGLGGAYVFAVFAVFLGGFLVFEVLRGRKRARPTATGGGGGDDGLRFPSLAKIALALAVPLYVASPVVVTLVSLLFGMTGRSLVGRDAGGGEHAYGAVTGAACGAAAIFLSPMLVHSKKTSRRNARAAKAATVLFVATVATLWISHSDMNGGAWSVTKPLPVVMTTVVPGATGTSSTRFEKEAPAAAVLVQPAGPGSLRRVLLFTLVPIRPRRRGERRSLRTFAIFSLRPHLVGFNPRPRRLSTPLLTPFNPTPTSLHTDPRPSEGSPRRCGARRARAWTAAAAAAAPQGTSTSCRTARTI